MSLSHRTCCFGVPFSRELSACSPCKGFCRLPIPLLFLRRSLGHVRTTISSRILCPNKWKMSIAPKMAVANDNIRNASAGTGTASTERTCVKACCACLTSAAAMTGQLLCSADDNMIVCTYTDYAATKHISLRMSACGACLACRVRSWRALCELFGPVVLQVLIVLGRQATLSLRASGSCGTALKRCKKEVGGLIHHTYGC